MISTKKPGTPEELVQLQINRVKEMKWGATKPGLPSDLVQSGVKGMKWGVRKQYESVTGKVSGVKEKVQSKREVRRERRAQRHETNAKAYQRDINKIQAKSSKWPGTQFFRNRQIRELRHRQNIELKAAKDIRAGRMTDQRKHIAIGVGVAAAILAAYGTYKLIDSGTARQLLTKDVPFKKNDLLSRKMSTDSIMKEVVKPINPKYGELGTKMNCRRCTMAYEMRRRGLDVKSTQTVGGTGQTVAGMLNATNPESHLKTGKPSMFTNLMKEHFQKGGSKTLTEAALTKGGVGDIPVGPKGGNLRGLNKLSKTERILETISKNPEGSRGELGMKWSMGGAHSMAWEIIGGKPVIIDTQNGIKYVTRDEFADVADHISNAGITRLDNIPNLNEGFLRKWVQNA